MARVDCDRYSTHETIRNSLNPLFSMRFERISRVFGAIRTKTSLLNGILWQASLSIRSLYSCKLLILIVAFAIRESQMFFMVSPHGLPVIRAYRSMRRPLAKCITANQIKSVYRLYADIGIYAYITLYR
jgi:hypothetical protein